MPVLTVDSDSDQFANEEVASVCGYYLPGYQPKPITKQVAILRKRFPELGSADLVLANREPPQGAEAWFAIPRWERVAPTYNTAVQRVLEFVKKTRKRRLRHWGKEMTGSADFRQHERTVAMMKLLSDQQSGRDILIVPAQFGLRHRGRSFRRARVVMNDNEFGLDTFAVGSMLVTHPERFQYHTDLSIDCAGDDYVFRCGHERVPYVPHFGFDLPEGPLEFGCRHITDAVDYCGSASGFVP